MSKNSPARRRAIFNRIANRRRRDFHGNTTVAYYPQETPVEIALADAAEQMRHSHGVPTDQKDREIYAADRAQYEKAIGRAIRAGQFEHPLVREWISERRSLGERDALRKFRMGLEGGAKRTMSKQNFWVAFEAGNLAHPEDAAKKGERPEAILRALIRKLSISQPASWFDLNDAEIAKLRARLKDMPRQNFHRLLRRLHVI